MKILVVEDEVRLSESLCRLLQDARYTAEAVHDGRDGLFYAQSGQYDAVVLDVMLPGMNGFEMARALRESGSSLPVLMLTAREGLRDKVRGLDCGADDYMTKPFAPEELLARLRALLRRQGKPVGEELTVGDVTLDLAAYTLRCGDKSVRLGNKEFELMRLLMANPHTVVAKDTLIVRIWGAESEAEDNNVEAYVSFLRKKLFYLGSQVNVCVVRKVGYYLSEK